MSFIVGIVRAVRHRRLEYENARALRTPLAGPLKIATAFGVAHRYCARRLGLSRSELERYPAD
jgi:hypothetical protein